MFFYEFLSEFLFVFFFKFLVFVAGILGTLKVLVKFLKSLVSVNDLFKALIFISVSPRTLSIFSIIYKPLE